MKKLFLALSVLAVLTFGAVPSQALVSMPDAVPGTNILIPFFFSKIDGGESTLVVVQEVKGQAATLTINVLDIDSVSQIDTSDILTAYDVGAWNVRDTWISLASDNAKDLLSIDVSGDGVNDHYAGYVTIDNSPATLNNLTSFIYQIDLDNGVAAGVLGASVETEYNIDTDTALVNAASEEQFSGDALVLAKEAIAGVAAADATWFDMYPRYYIYNSNGTNYWFSWRDTTQDYTHHVNWYDTAENPISSNIYLLHEMDFINVATYLPNGHKTSYPYAGWVDLTTTVESIQWIMYNYQKVVGGTASSNWNALFDVHRDAGTAG